MKVNELKQLKKKDCVWRKRNEANKKPFITHTVKFSGGWCEDVFHGVDALVQIDGIMNADKYIEIINERGSCENESLEEFIFQQDNDPKHTVKKSKKFFGDLNIKLLK